MLTSFTVCRQAQLLSCHIWKTPFHSSPPSIWLLRSPCPLFCHPPWVGKCDVNVPFVTVLWRYSLHFNQPWVSVLTTDNLREPLQLPLHHVCHYSTHRLIFPHQYFTGLTAGETEIVFPSHPIQHLLLLRKLASREEVSRSEPVLFLHLVTKYVVSSATGLIKTWVFSLKMVLFSWRFSVVLLLAVAWISLFINLCKLLISSRFG